MTHGLRLLMGSSISDGVYSLFKEPCYFQRIFEYFLCKIDYMSVCKYLSHKLISFFGMIFTALRQYDVSRRLSQRDLSNFHILFTGTILLVITEYLSKGHRCGRIRSLASPSQRCLICSFYPPTYDIVMRISWSDFVNRARCFQDKKK